MRYIVLATAIWLTVFAINAFADTVNGQFTPPTEREDNTPLTAAEIGAYRLYIDGVETQQIPPTENTFTIELSPGTYDINLTTVDTDGRESVFSETITQVILASPKPPTGTVITITIQVQ